MNRVLFTLSRGRKQETNKYTAKHQISGDGLLTVDIRSHESDPIASLIDRGIITKEGSTNQLVYRLDE